MIRHGGLVSVGVARVFGLVPAAGSAQARVVVHTAGAQTGRVSIVVPFTHPPDRSRPLQHVDFALRSGGRTLAKGTTLFRASATRSLRVEHRLMLDRPTSSAVIAAGRQPLLLRARWREGHGSAKSLFRKPILLQRADEPALGASYEGSNVALSVTAY